MKPASAPKRPLALIQVLVLIGVLAVAGGLALAIRPDGRWLRLPLELLDTTPFTSYRIPGVILALVVGGSQLGAAHLAWHRRTGHLRAASLAAVVLAGWIGIQVVMIGAVTWLQPLCFVAAIGELMLVGAAVPRTEGAKASAPRTAGKAARKSR